MLHRSPVAHLGGLLDRGGDGDAALVADGAIVSYRDLRRRVALRRADLDCLAPSSLVVIVASNTVEFVVTYLALFAEHHVPLVVGRHADRLADSWNADAVIATATDRIDVDVRHDTSAHVLHDDLALLLSTSGSTGAAKLVRLSHHNVASNAAAIAEYLELTAADRAITTLPLHYCYGLSVLHSHLFVGASIVLSDASVVDPCFADAVRRHGVTNVAGVPHTFELLDRAGRRQIDVDTLRFVTQAGGRLAPDRVDSWARWLGERDVDLFVMYGQTEATSRMAYLPPHLATHRPEAIGQAIPGGELALRPVAGDDGLLDDGVGELVYRGANVMLGYASTSDDLALGATLDELSTGDLARFHADDNVFEIVGRASRFVKPFGLRVDLDAVERELLAMLGGRRDDVSSGDAEPVEVAVAGDDRALVVTAPGADTAAVRQRVVEFTELPAAMIVVDVAGELPRTGSGKPDYAAIVRRAVAEHDDAAAPGDVDDDGDDDAAQTSVASIFGAVLNRVDVDGSDTFVSLGGDSLSYVECSVQLERVLGELPSEWHLRSVDDLETQRGRSARGMPHVDITVLFRAIGIGLIVSTHMKFLWFPGGAHLLLVVVGYNVARFLLPIEPVGARLRAAARSLARVAVPTVVFVGICMFLVGGYSIPTLTLTNNYVAPRSHARGLWHYWYIEVYVAIVAVIILLVAAGPLRRLERRHRYAFPLFLFAGALVWRYGWWQWGDLHNLRFRTHGVAWFVLLGWMVHAATTTRTKLFTAAVAMVTIVGFFDRPEREWFVITGVLLLLWVAALPMPRVAIVVLSTVAAASMWIFIVHFRVWPVMNRNLPRAVAWAVTISVGVLSWKAATVAESLAAAGWRRSRSADRADQSRMKVTSSTTW